MIWLKSKLALIGAGLVAIMGIIIAVLRGNIERLEREKVEQELEDAKAAHKQSEKATEALIRGTTEESKNEGDNRRNYSFDD